MASQPRSPNISPTKKRQIHPKKPFPLFIRTKEDFVCGHCGAHAKGTGYTNHCPTCLWSMHVDINPGDRKASCHGMMQPVSVDIEGSSYNILHVCMRCGYQKRNISAPDDDFNSLVKLIKTLPKPKK